MVNKIDNNNYYDYQKLKNVNIPDSGEKFNLEYNRKELQSEADKNKASNSTDAQKQAEENAGVRLELSSQGKTASAERSWEKEGSKTHAAADAESIIDTIRGFIADAITAVKTFFYNLWYDPQPETDIQASQEQDDFAKTLESAVETEAVESSDIPENMDEVSAYRMKSERLDREIQKHLRSGDLNQVISLLTDDGKKTIARNSSLLTYYDRNGRMVEPNASDRERILHGDINTRKL